MALRRTAAAFEATSKTTDESWAANNSGLSKLVWENLPKTNNLSNKQSLDKLDQLAAPQNITQTQLPPDSPKLAPYWTLRSKNCGTTSRATAG